MRLSGWRVPSREARFLVAAVVGPFSGGWQDAQCWRKDEGDDEAADALDDIGGDAGDGAGAVEGVFVEEVAACDEEGVDEAAEDDGEGAAFGGVWGAADDEAAEGGDDAFDEKGGGDVEGVAADEIGQAGAEAGGEKAWAWAKQQSGEDDEGVAGMDVAAGAGGWDADHEGGYAGEGGKEGGEHEALGVVVHVGSLLRFSVLHDKTKLAL